MKDNKRNPVLILFLGACPALGATTDVRAALGMGAAVLLALLLSVLVTGALRRVIPEHARLAANVLIAAGCVSLTQILLRAFVPSVYQMLGVYLAAAAVELLLFRELEAAGEGSLGTALKNSLLTGLCFFALLFVLAAVRELLGSASFAGLSVGFLSKFKIGILTQPAGGLIVYSILAAVANRICPAELALTGITGKAAGATTQGE